ncbi:hypothetical protein TRIUR3_20273 [Triticum urartu]|uniref:Uncharacterized protein n=1 Tax=Triticum urartu TaxID=4572 RepID=M7Z6P3_TRIUA|nr:hypothetical protein TRIUR3_20273 [Triticum urartu]
MGSRCSKREPLITSGLRRTCLARVMLVHEACPRICGRVLAEVQNCYAVLAVTVI